MKWEAEGFGEPLVPLGMQQQEHSVTVLWGDLRLLAANCVCGMPGLCGVSGPGVQEGRGSFSPKAQLPAVISALGS